MVYLPLKQMTIIYPPEAVCTKNDHLTIINKYIKMEKQKDKNLHILTTPYIFI